MTREVVVCSSVGMAGMPSSPDNGHLPCCCCVNFSHWGKAMVEKMRSEPPRLAGSS